MSQYAVAQQVHGYKSGHQLLFGNIKLSREDQDTVDRLSDISGSLRPGEEFSPYLTIYPLPGRSHVVVARTWQDLQAPRAGCVKTRSLFIPTERWIKSESIQAIVDCIPQIGLAEPSSEITIIEHEVETPPVKEPRGVELIEAMFLEARQPTVMFEAIEAELIAIRLLQALWPSIRQSFAVCTFALAPRKILGREFDLVFAPKTARSRFSDWMGRKIEAGSTLTARHRWSSETAARILVSNSPTLTNGDTLGVLNLDRSSDGSALRLVLLWSELTSKAESNPTAVLGLLDILSTMKQENDAALTQLQPLILHAISISRHVLGVDGAWTFLSTLVGKFPTRLPASHILRSIEKFSSDLASEDPASAVQFLNVHSAARAVPAILMSGIGHGLANTAAIWSEEALIKSIQPATTSEIFALSKEFVHRYLQVAEASPSQWLRQVVDSLNSAEPRLRRKLRRRFLPNLNSDTLAPLVGALLIQTPPSEFYRFVVEVGKRTRFEHSTFDLEILNAANDNQDCILSIRQAIVQNFESSKADRFLLNSLKFSLSDIIWVDQNVHDPFRCNHIATNLLRSTSNQRLSSVLMDRNAKDAVLGMLAYDISNSAVELARVIVQGDCRSDDAFEIAIQSLEFLAKDQAKELGVYLLERSLALPSISKDVSVNLLERFGHELDTRRLFSLMFQRTTPASRISYHLEILQQCDRRIISRAAGVIDLISEVLISRQREGLTEAAYRSWASLIIASGAKDPQAQVRAAVQVLQYALKLTRYPASELIVASFPIVYRYLPKNKEDGYEYLVVPMVAIAINLLRTYADWDRAKAAEQDLVSAFVDSQWPAIDLYRAANSADIEEKILKRLKQHYRGEDFLRRLDREMSKVPHSYDVRLPKAWTAKSKK